MKEIILYWSNICILHKFELNALENATALLRKKGISLVIKHFGIGYPTRMAEYLLQDDALLPDIIVSTDLEVFENDTIFSKFKDNLYPLQQHFKLKQAFQNHAVNRLETLLPFLVIPLIFSSNQDIKKDLSIEEVVQKKTPTCFGGMENSGSKSVLKAIWSHYGIEALQGFLDVSTITNMPIQSFQAIRTHMHSLALVPSIYAEAGTGQGLTFAYPTNGAIALPSYITARKSVPLDDVKTVLETLLTADFCNYFVDAGKLVCCLDIAKETTLSAEQDYQFLYPSNDWFLQTPQTALEKIYQTYLS